VNPWLQHLPVVPIVAPLATGAAMLLFGESRRVPRVALALTSAFVQLVAAATLLYLSSDAVPEVWPEGIGVYGIGGWPAPFGIVLVVDRLSALMLTLGTVLGLAALVYSLTRWDRVGVHYHPLFQFLMMGLAGAFLTGDLFNLFVFFEVLLAASYGLLLHGSGRARVKAGLHYIVVNLLSSLAFLVGVAMIYGVAGTLNMADLAVHWPALQGGDRALFEAGAAILGVAFLVKAGSWPLNFWLPPAYAAAGASVAAVLAIMTKVGVYAILRLGSLLADTGAPAPFGGPLLFYLAIATMVLGIVGMLATQQLERLIAFTVIMSSGILLAALGTGAPSMTAPALFYLVNSVLATGAFFMLAGMIERVRTTVPERADAAALAPATYAAFAVEDPPDPYGPDDEIGLAIPAAMAFLGLAFLCCGLLVTGLPPLSGFIAKFALLSAAFGAAGGDGPGPDEWLLIWVLIGGGLAAVIALTRKGMRVFWSGAERVTPRLRIIEAGPVAFLVSLCIALTVVAGPVMTYLDSIAHMLQTPQIYVRAVLSPHAGTPPDEAGHGQAGP